MSVPKGRNCRVEVAATFSTPITVTALTKASPGAATASAHGMSAGAVGYWTVSAGMVELDGMAGSVQGVATNTFNVERVDTSGFSTWTAGTFTPAATFTTLSKSTSYSIAGGDADELDASTLLDTNRQVEFGLLGAETVSFNQLSDLQSTGMVAIEAAARAGTPLLFRITLSNTERRVFYGTVTMPNEEQGISQLATGAFKVAVKGRVLRLPVAS